MKENDKYVFQIIYLSQSDDKNISQTNNISKLTLGVRVNLTQYSYYPLCKVKEWKYLHYHTSTLMNPKNIQIEILNSLGQNISKIALQTNTWIEFSSAS